VARGLFPHLPREDAGRPPHRGRRGARHPLGPLSRSDLRDLRGDPARRRIGPALHRGPPAPRREPALPESGDQLGAARARRVVDSRARLGSDAR
jgi:hypothetical protein